MFKITQHKHNGKLIHIKIKENTRKYPGTYKIFTQKIEVL